MKSSEKHANYSTRLILDEMQNLATMPKSKKKTNLELISFPKKPFVNLHRRSTREGMISWEKQYTGSLLESAIFYQEINGINMSQ